MWKMYLIFRVLLLLYSIYIFIFFIFECYSLLINLVLEIIKHAERKKIWSKFYLTISNFLKKLAWLLWFWIEYGSNYPFFFPESKFSKISDFKEMRCYGGIFNFPTLNIWEIDLLGTSYIHANFQTCRICRTAKLEVAIPILCTTVTNYILNWGRSKYQ